MNYRTRFCTLCTLTETTHVSRMLCIIFYTVKKRLKIVADRGNSLLTSLTGPRRISGKEIVFVDFHIKGTLCHVIFVIPDIWVYLVPHRYRTEMVYNRYTISRLMNRRDSDVKKKISNLFINSLHKRIEDYFTNCVLVTSTPQSKVWRDVYLRDCINFHQRT